MSFFSLLYISIGASLGAILRYFLGLFLNGIFPSIPLGTLASNILGGFLMGVFLGIAKMYPLIPEAFRLAVATGFLGGLTTFSTFSAELFTLLSFQQYFFSISIIVAHVLGSVIATFLGVFSVKYFLV
ncbi:MAG: fluoride efflux transporter CrcB [Chlamydiae bacterium]|nr:fluoride efflux transporter CrcB [Chlamydiota bacterium]